MADPIDVAPGVVVPAAAIETHAVRSAGPGGQNVNKVSSKIELLVHLDQVTGLDASAVDRLLVLARRKIAAGRLRVTSQESRDRLRNLESARDKVRVLLLSALEVAPPRKPTRPRVAAREKRLASKHRASRIKSTRRVPAGAASEE